MVAALVVLHRRLSRATRDVAHLPWLADRELRHRITSYSLPRAVSSGLEQSIVWIGILLVGIIAGSPAAGVYGTAARFVGAGVIVATALRVVVAPRFSALLGRGRGADVEQLYSVTARWILVFGSPVYVLLAVYAPTVLGWLGPGFSEGTSAMAILCLGSVVMLAAGNVQSLLLMSGGSGWAAVNKSIALAVNVGGTFALVPLIGIEGAAISWIAGMAIDTSLAAFQVRRATGIALDPAAIVGVAALVALCVGAPSWLVVLLLGQGTSSLLLGMVLSGLALCLGCYLARRPLHVSELGALFARRGSRADPG
jgi:O-antigen/teichoic acid export membrane protein